MRQSIKFRLICGIITIITIPLLCIFGIITFRIIDISRSNYIVFSSTELKRANAAIQLFLNEAGANMDHLASHPDLRNIDAGLTDFLQPGGMVPTLPRNDDTLGRRLRESCILLQHSHPNYRKVYLGSRYGGFISSSDAPRNTYDPRARAWFKSAAANPDKAIISPPFRSTDGEATVSAARAFADGSGKTLGVVSADISLSVITDMVKNIRPGRTGFVIVTEKDGGVIADTLHPERSLKKRADLGDASLQTLLVGPAGEVETTLKDKTYVANIFDSPENGWRFVSCIEKQEILEPALKTVATIACVALASLVLIVGGIWLFMDRLVIHPLSRVAVFLQAIGSGRFDIRLEAMRRDDEIAAMFAALNAMADQLGETVTAVQAKSREAEEKALACQAATDKAEEASTRALQARKEGVLQAANRLENVVSVVSLASTTLLSRIRQASRDSEVHAQRVEETASAMQEMNATVVEVAKNASEAARTSSQARGKAASGTETISRVATSLEQVRNDARQSKQQMGDLGRQAERIGGILGIINDIADQTNLLALNAAIEAARAGDAGRGFAVVADEVRKLAEKTVHATQEVESAIRGIQDGTRRTCDAVDRSAEAIEQTVTLAEESSKILSQITSLSDSTADQIQSIATASEQQSASSDAINRSIGEISVLSASTAEAMHHSIQDVTSVADQVGELSSLITEMQSDGL